MGGSLSINTHLRRSHALPHVLSQQIAHCPPLQLYLAHSPPATRVRHTPRPVRGCLGVVTGASRGLPGRRVAVGWVDGAWVVSGSRALVA